ncbi:unnamed protein product [Gordionus sp. m RMFG-2023]
MFSKWRLNRPTKSLHASLCHASNNYQTLNDSDNQVKTTCSDAIRIDEKLSNEKKAAVNDIDLAANKRKNACSLLQPMASEEEDDWKQILVNIPGNTIDDNNQMISGLHHKSKHLRSLSTGCNHQKNSLSLITKTRINNVHSSYSDSNTASSYSYHYRSLSGGIAELTQPEVPPETKLNDTSQQIHKTVSSVSPFNTHANPTSPVLTSNEGMITIDMTTLGDGLIESHVPGVTIIKPLLGFDPNLELNLRTFFLLHYPKFEISFCVQDYEDPCINIVKGLMMKFPHVDVSLFLGSPEIVVNSKINNMIPAFDAAKYELILVSDAGIMMPENSLTEMVYSMTRGVGLVHQMPFTAPNRGYSFPAVLEKVYFGTAHARIYLASDFLGINCCTGMSSLYRKRILSSAGLASFGKYLAEDYFMARAVRSAGYKHRISPGPALQNATPTSVRAFQERLVRWSKLRFTMVPVTILFEPLSECLVLGLLNSWAVFYLFEWNSLVFFAIHCLVWFLLDYALLRIVQNGKLPFSRTQFLLAWCYRELSALPLFLVALNTSVLKWKNNTYRLKWGGYVEKINVPYPSSNNYKNGRSNLENLKIY